MRSVACLGLVFSCTWLIGCQDSPVDTRTPELHRRTTVEPTWPPSQTEYYSSDYAPIPDDDVELSPNDEIVGGYTCPLLVNSITIPGNVYPFHKVKTGTLLYPNRRKLKLGFSPGGIPKARYAIPTGLWVSEDLEITVLSGTVDVYCLYTAVPHTGVVFASGALHVYSSDVQILGNPGTPPDSDPCEFAELIYDPYGGHTVQCPAEGSGGGGGGGGSTSDDCTWEYITIEVDYHTGNGWEVFWQGWGWWCGETT
jgi:hypothetical protein